MPITQKWSSGEVKNYGRMYQLLISINNSLFFPFRKQENKLMARRLLHFQTDSRGTESEANKMYKIVLYLEWRTLPGGSNGNLRPLR